MPVIEIPDSVLSVNGVEIPTVTIKLSGGRTVHIRQANGSDMMRAQRGLSEKASATEILYALIARCATLNGKPMKLEDITHLSLGAIRKITVAFNSLNDEDLDPEPVSDDDEDPVVRPIEPPA